MKKIIIIFGSTSGNTELVCDKVSCILKEHGIDAKVQRAENSSVDDVTKSDLCILAASTYGHGILQDHFIPLAAQLKKTDLSGIRFAVIGLGDDKYDAEYNVESAVILERIAQEQGGELLLPALKINKPPVPQLDGAVKKWAEKLADVIKSPGKKHGGCCGGGCHR